MNADFKVGDKVSMTKIFSDEGVRDFPKSDT
jgi:hypothetical protein